VECERAALRALQAGCSAPIGVHASLEGGVMRVALAIAPGGGSMLRRVTEERVDTPAQAQALGRRIAQQAA